jgi:hypothetical protein
LIIPLLLKKRVHRRGAEDAKRTIRQDLQDSPVSKGKTCKILLILSDIFLLSFSKKKSVFHRRLTQTYADEQPNAGALGCNRLSAPRPAGLKYPIAAR